jgi:hypothetical protein
MTPRMTWLLAAFFLLWLSSSAVAQDDFMEPSRNNEAVPTSPDATVPEESPPPENNNQNKSINTVGLLAGYAVDFENFGYNPYGIGLGVRGGHTFDFGFYLGGKFLYFLGGTDFYGRHNETAFSLELGYDFDIDPITIRPSMDFGLETHRLSTQTGGASKDYFFLGAGVSFIVSLDVLFFALDVRYMAAFDANPVEGMAFLGNLGVRY